uniref:Uncharacterized protein n=1 Tax=Anguilla anguilla TaxID=7936 RepID=A0A0E9PZA9_ANGAN
MKATGALLLYCLQVSVPCILISIAFAIWGKIESMFCFVLLSFFFFKFP